MLGIVDTAAVTTDKLLKRIGQAIRTARGDESQDSLASRAGVSRIVLGRIEKGVSNYEFQSLLRILDACKLKFTDLVGFDEDDPPYANKKEHKMLQDLLDHGGEPARWITGNLPHLNS
jgi:transcriptional regulator with XRE-family HTH domain